MNNPITIAGNRYIPALNVTILVSAPRKSASPFESGARAGVEVTTFTVIVSRPEGVAYAIVRLYPDGSVLDPADGRPRWLDDTIGLESFGFNAWALARVGIVEACIDVETCADVGQRASSLSSILPPLGTPVLVWPSSMDAATIARCPGVIVEHDQVRGAVRITYLSYPAFRISGAQQETAWFGAQPAIVPTRGRWWPI